MNGDDILKIAQQNPDVGVPADVVMKPARSAVSARDGRVTEVASSGVPTKYSVRLPYPPSANRYWRMGNGRMRVSTEAKQYKKHVALVCAGADVNEPATSYVALRVRLYRPRKSGDLDNRLKVLIDSLNNIAWLDDEQIVYIEARRYDDKDAPRAEVTWSEVPDPNYATPEEWARIMEWVNS